MTFKHIPIMLEQCLLGLDINPQGVYVDGTLGGGGHAKSVLQQLEGGRLIGIDRDFDAIRAASVRLAAFSQSFVAYQGNYCDMAHILSDNGIAKVDGILLDLGVSSYQLDTAARGFSYQHDAMLDMRMNQRAGITAADVVNTYSEKALAELIKTYGEERWAKRIAAFIVERRQASPIQTTGQLVDVIKAAVPKGARQSGPHPAKRTFQAIRIEVNDELAKLKDAIDAMSELLNPAGRLAIITFHSLEDRIVKQSFKRLATDCICPPQSPICQCDHRATVKVITRKPIVPSAAEIEDNPRARSAKLRVCQKL